tara:strand:+ start:987 stop:1361 length:375 start_codon:yes stop_codon:yes gene_type:complete
MPYITKEQVKAKRKALKAALPQFKLSVTTEHYSGIKVAIMEGPINFGIEYTQLNPHIDYRAQSWNRYTEEYDSNPPVQDLLDIVMPILNEGKGASTEDGDYGSIPDYYTWVHIGKWDRPYDCIQ